MDTEKFTRLLDSLDGSLDNLETALEPLLTNNLSSITSKLPLLDKAKLHVLVVYAFESMLFSSLKLNSTTSSPDHTTHPLYEEIKRCQLYYRKIAEAEASTAEAAKTGTQQNPRLDKAAASRFIKHALAGTQPSNSTGASGSGHGTLQRDTLAKDSVASKRKASAPPESEENSHQDGSSVNHEQQSKRPKTEEEMQAYVSAEKQARREARQAQREGRAVREAREAGGASGSGAGSRISRVKSAKAPRAAAAVMADLLQRGTKGGSKSSGKEEG